MKTKKVVKIIANVAIWVIFALSLITVIFTLNTNKNGIANIFGLGYLTIQSDSMEPVFQKGDLIYVTTTGEDDVFEEGDIVTFHTVIEGIETFNTHRIIDYITVGQTRYYTTQGDNVNQSDNQTITSGDIVAKYTGVRLVGVGYVMDFVDSSLGFFLVVVLPLAALFVYQIINFAILMANFKHEHMAPASLTDEQKAEIAKQYLESLNAKAAEEQKSNVVEEPKTEITEESKDQVIEEQKTEVTEESKVEDKKE